MQVIWSPGMPLETATDQIIEAAYTFYKGNKTQTARSLNIAIRTLDNKLEKMEERKKEQDARVKEHQKQRESFLHAQRHGSKGLSGLSADFSTPASIPASGFDLGLPAVK